MKLNHRSFIFLSSACLAMLVLAVVPLRAADDNLSQPAQSSKTGELHYLAPAKPDAAALLAPPPLPDSAEQAADLDEVRSVYHAASSNDMAAAYAEKKFSVFNFAPAVGAFFQSNSLPRTTVFFEKVQLD